MKINIKIKTDDNLNMLLINKEFHSFLRKIRQLGVVHAWDIEIDKRKTDSKKISC